MSKSHCLASHALLRQSVTPVGSGEASFFNECFCCENTGVEPDFGEEFTVPASMLFPCVAYSKGLLLHFPVGYPAQIHRNHFSISA